MTDRNEPRVARTPRRARTTGLALVIVGLAAAVAAPTVHAAAPSPQWTRQFGTPESDQVFDIALDGSRNVIVVGETLGDLGRKQIGDGDAFVQKRRPNGAVLWTRQFGTKHNDIAYGVGVDRAGNIYVVGATRGNLARPNQGGDDAFVRKYSPAGKARWTRQFGTGIADVARDVAVDRSGDVYVAGEIGRVDEGSSDGFVRRMSPAGRTRWTHRIRTPEFEEAVGVTIDGAGNAYAAGHTLGSLGGPNLGGLDVFLRKVSPKGKTRWTRQIGSDTWEMADAVGVDRKGNAIVLGQTQGVIGDSKLGPQDLFLRKVSPKGAVVWTRQVGSTQSESAGGLAIDRAGNAYVAGDTNGDFASPQIGSSDAILLKVGPGGGPRWSMQFGTDDQDGAWAVAVDGNGRAHVAGGTRGALKGTNKGDIDVFIRRYAAK
jgi:hypothetical protein